MLSENSNDDGAWNLGRIRKEEMTQEDEDIDKVVGSVDSKSVN